MVRTVTALSLFLAAAVAAHAADKDKPAKAGLDVGDPAPAIKVVKWIKGEPVQLKKGEVYVVEFWATWCGPCIQSIPHLNDMAKKFEGKATFAGISVNEQGNDEEIETNVGKFVKKMGDKMDYHVAIDGKAGVMNAKWLEASQSEGIPTAFIVAKDGRIAWIGHPLDGMDKVLDEVVKGTFDVTAYAEKRRKEREAAVAEQALLKKLQKLLAKEDWKEALAALDQAGENNAEVAKKLGALRFRILLETDEAAAYTYGKKVVAGDLKENVNGLYMVARSILDPAAKRKKPDYGLAVAAAERANELTDKKHPEVLSVLGDAYFKNGDTDKAVQAVKDALKSKDLDPDSKTELEAKLKKYQKGENKKD